MTSDITSEIAQRLDVEPDVVRPLLEKTLERIRREVEHVGHARLSGLGTFRRRDDGLTFEPDPSLAETINARFTGLQDIVLEPSDPDRLPGDTPLPVEEDEGPLETSWNQDPADGHPLGPGSEPSFEDAEYLVVGSRKVDGDRTRTRESPSVAWRPTGSAGHTRDAGVDTPDGPDSPTSEERIAAGPEPARGTQRDETADQARADAAARTEGHSDEPSEDRSAGQAAIHREVGPESTPGTTRPPTRRDRERDPKTVWFGAGIIVLVAAAAIATFLLIDRPQEAPVQEIAQVETPPAVPETAPSEGGQDGEAAAVQNDEPPPPSPSSPFSAPLRSDGEIVPAAGGYTIVVYSETNQNLAEEQVARYRGEGFRSSLLTLEEGVARFRVGVGQFETLEEAAQQRNEHAGAALPADSWVLRLGAP